jgi:hypothetical protein
MGREIVKRCQLKSITLLVVVMGESFNVDAVRECLFLEAFPLFLSASTPSNDCSAAWEVA